MNKQHFDHIESRIRQAANEISTPESDEAWKKMEVMLDREFRKDRRRGGIWWWLLGVAVILFVSGLFIYQHHSSRFGHTSLSVSPLPQEIKSKIEADQEPDTNKNNKIEDDQFANVENRTEKTVTDGSHQQKNPAVSIPKQKHLNIKRHPAAKDPTSISAAIPEKRDSKKLSANSGKFKKVKSTSSVSLVKEMITREAKNTDSRERTKSVHENKVGSTGNQTAKVSGNDPVDKDSSHSTVSANSDTNDSVANNSLLIKNSPPVRSANSRKKGLYVVGSTAADVTAIKNIFKQNARPVYGLAIGYQFNRRLNVQAGFYTGKKFYAAGPDDYKIKPGSYIAKIIRADAECDIYELPVSIRYNFLPRRAFNGYLMAGFSSVILKKETYDMHFYNASGAYRRMSYTYKDNTDFLSIFALSIGFEHKLSNSLYIQAEPYLKLPLSGLGEGQVKLYSAGLQMGIKYQPFSNKKKKF